MTTLNPPRASSKLPLILAIIVGLAAVGGGGLFLWSRLRPAPAANLPPIVVNRVPERGEEQGTESPIVVSFDKPMDRASVEQSFAISPKIPGSFKWNDANTAVQFVPTGSGFARGETYNVTLSDTAKAENGKTLGQPIAFTFKAVGFVEVTQVIPADGAQDIDPASEITVMFNRPIVPIRSASDTTPLPDPVTFDPPLTGKGEWLNTSIYVFRPDKRMESGVKYTAKIAAGLQDPTGAILQKDYMWTFTTQLPQVIAFSPSDAESDVWIDAAVKVTFNQPMDHPSSEAAFSLHQGSPDGPQVAGAFSWYTTTLPGSAMPVGAIGQFVASAGKLAAPALGGGGQRTTSDFVTDVMVFTPTQKLERDTVYHAKMIAGAKGSKRRRSHRLRFALVVHHGEAVVRHPHRSGQRRQRRTVLVDGDLLLHADGRSLAAQHHRDHADQCVERVHLLQRLRSPLCVWLWRGTVVELSSADRQGRGR